MQSLLSGYGEDLSIQRDSEGNPHYNLRVDLKNWLLAAAAFFARDLLCIIALLLDSWNCDLMWLGWDCT